MKKTMILIIAIITFIKIEISGAADAKVKYGMQTQKIGEITEIKIPKIKQSPIIDGKLDDKCWKNYTGLEFGFLSGNQETFPTEKTKTFLVYDNENLYISFKCFDSQMDKLENNVTQRDGKVWGDDYIEIFLDTKHNHKTAYQIMINPNGTIFDNFCNIELFEENISCDLDFQVATSIEKDFWIVEVKIPFKNIGIEKPFKNICGINLNRGYQDKGNGFEDTSLFPTFTESSFIPDKFGDLILEIK
ncbi:MAG: sugar-binding protein [bacterium]